VRPDHEHALSVYAAHLKRRNLAPATAKKLTRTASYFLGWLGKPLARARQPDVRRYLAYRARDLGAAAQVGELSRLRGFLDALVSHGLLPQSPADGLRVQTPPRPARPLLSEEAVRALFEAASRGAPGEHPARALRDRACLELLYGLGVRASEARASLVPDLNLIEGSLLVRRVKHGDPRVLLLPPAALPHLERYLREGRPALAGGRGRDRGRLLLSNRGSPLEPSGVAGIVRQVARRADRSAHPHAFRRALASHLSKRGVSVLAIQELLGHRRLDTTQVYLTLDMADLRKAVEILEVGERLPG